MLVERQVAEIWAIFTDPDGGETEYPGSGYLVSPEWVLTSRHLVEGAASVDVRLGDAARLPSRPRGDVVLFPDGVDAALVRVPRMDAEPARFATLDPDSDEPFAWQTRGYPSFKRRGSGDAERRGRTLVSGTVTPSSNREADDPGSVTLELLLDGQPPAPDEGADQPSPARSPWGALSGAPIWVNDRIVGVVHEHRMAEGARSLTASALQPWPDAPLPALREPATLRSESPRNRVLREARAVAAVLAPAFEGREEELAVLERLGRGESDRDEPSPDKPDRHQPDPDHPDRHQPDTDHPDTDQPDTDQPSPDKPDPDQPSPDQPGRDHPGRDGGARGIHLTATRFAGKTALLAKWCSEPPRPGRTTERVSCFIRRVVDGEHDAGHVRRTLARQLAALASEPLPDRTLQGTELEVAFREALRHAVEYCDDTSRRLVVVIDGLDEFDDPRVDLDDLLAPLLRHDRVLLVVSSKADADVGITPDLTPLHIEPSPAATDLERRARSEISQAISGKRAREVLLWAVTTAGGLTTGDVAELARVGMDAAGVRRLIETKLSHVLQLRREGEGEGAATLGFAHVLLRDAAIAALDEAMPATASALVAWARRSRSQGWSADTPRYLLRQYPGTLIDLLGRTRGDRALEIAAELVDTVTDRDRWTAQLVLGDAARAGDDRIATQRALRDLERRMPAYRAIVDVTRIALEHVPMAGLFTTALPLVVAEALAGDVEAATRLAEAILEPDGRVQALAGISLARWAGGEREEALRRAREVVERVNADPRPEPLRGALVASAQLQALVGALELAEATLDGAEESDRRRELGRVCGLRRADHADAARGIALRLGAAIEADPREEDHLPLIQLAIFWALEGDAARSDACLEQADEAVARARFAHEGKYELWAADAVDDARHRVRAIELARTASDPDMVAEKVDDDLRRTIWGDARESVLVIAAVGAAGFHSERLLELARTRAQRLVSTRQPEDGFATRREITDVVDALLAGGYRDLVMELRPRLTGSEGSTSDISSNQRISIEATLAESFAADGHGETAERLSPGRHTTAHVEVIAIARTGADGIDEARDRARRSLVDHLRARGERQAMSVDTAVEVAVALAAEDPAPEHASTSDGEAISVGASSSARDDAGTPAAAGPSPDTIANDGHATDAGAAPPDSHATGRRCSSSRLARDRRRGRRSRRRGTRAHRRRRAERGHDAVCRPSARIRQAGALAAQAAAPGRPHDRDRARRHRHRRAPARARRRGRHRTRCARPGAARDSGRG